MRREDPATPWDRVGPVGELVASAGDSLKVGIVWSGSVTFKGNKKRAVAVERFIPLASVPGVQLFSLQARIGPRLVPTTNPSVRHHRRSTVAPRDR